jgi:tripartite-type tricarboxylate transporter receptor subunit TctC
VLPDVPTFAEAGLPFEARSWFLVAVPSSTPKPVVEKIAADVKRVVETPEYRERFINAMGMEPLNLGPAELEGFLQKDRAKYAERVKNANVRLD